jgi:ATP-binding cassette subfamily C protein
VVAHRLTQATRADRVVVLDAGRVVEAGTHADLVAAGGRYAGLWAPWQDRPDDSGRPWTWRRRSGDVRGHPRDIS